MSGTGRLFHAHQETPEFQEGYRADPDTENPYAAFSYEAQSWSLGHEASRDEYHAGVLGE